MSGMPEPSREELARYLESDLTQARAQEVEACLATSPAAREDLETLRRVLGCLAAPDEELLKVDLVDRVHCAVSSETNARLARSAVQTEAIDEAPEHHGVQRLPRGRWPGVPQQIENDDARGGEG